jgi:MSHA biogenesis protein MshJ
MKRTWQRLAAQIDQMSLRQRALMFAAVSLVVVLAAYVALIDPVLGKQKQLIDRVNRDQSQLTAVRAQLQSLLKEAPGAKQDPEQAALRALEERIAELEKSLGARKGVLVAPTRLPALLRELLGKNRQLKLESLKVLPAAEVSGELYRQGVELSLKGTYFDLLGYLSDLEKLPSRLLWGGGELQTELYPEVRLTFEVHTLTTQRSLLKAD